MTKPDHRGRRRGRRRPRQQQLEGFDLHSFVEETPRDRLMRMLKLITSARNPSFMLDKFLELLQDPELSTVFNSDPKYFEAVVQARNVQRQAYLASREGFTAQTERGEGEELESWYRKVLTEEASSPEDRVSFLNGDRSKGKSFVIADLLEDSEIVKLLPKGFKVADVMPPNWKPRDNSRNGSKPESKAPRKRKAKPKAKAESEPKPKSKQERVERAAAAQKAVVKGETDTAESDTAKAQLKAMSKSKRPLAKPSTKKELKERLEALEAKIVRAGKRATPEWLARQPELPAVVKKLAETTSNAEVGERLHGINFKALQKSWKEHWSN